MSDETAGVRKTLVDTLRFTFPYFTVVQTEPQQMEMHQYSDSSEEETESGVPASPRDGSNSRASQSKNSRAKVRFRYSKGTGGHAAKHDGP